jgi:RHS repeat-associated protein
MLSLNHATEGRQFYHFDALGSTVNLSKPDASLQARYQYDAWGNFRADSGSSFNAYTFTGHEKDRETDLYYFKARYYDPDNGRFLSQDSYLGDAETPPSLHRYLYAYSNPMVYVDLDGYESILLPQDLEQISDLASNETWADRWLWTPKRVDPESARFVRAAGGTVLERNGVGKATAEAVATRVNSVVGEQPGATALVIEEGDTYESVVQNMDEQLGTRWHRSSGKSLLARRLVGKQPGDIVDISMFFRAAYNETTEANTPALQGFAEDQSATAAETSFADTPAQHINAVSATIAADMQSTWRIANDPAAPRFMRSEARQSIVEGVGLSLMPLGIVNRGKAAGSGAKNAVTKRPVIIGETMTRVEVEAAKTPGGAKILNDMPEYWNMGLRPHEVTSKMMQYNRTWIHQQLKEGRRIIDIGTDPNRNIPSIFYQMEQQMLKNYEKLYPGTVSVTKP